MSSYANINKFRKLIKLSDNIRDSFPIDWNHIMLFVRKHDIVYTIDPSSGYRATDALGKFEYKHRDLMDALIGCLVLKLEADI